MSDHVRQTITLLEQELEVTHGRCHELEQVLATLRPLAGDVDEDDAPRRPAKTARTKPGPKPRAEPSEKLKDHGAAIIAMLKTHGGSMKPAPLAKALKISRPLMTYRMRSLIKAGAVVATGNTGNRQFSLPPRGRAAKEAP